MAKEAAEAFVKRYASDEAFRDKVNTFEGPGATRTFLHQERFGEFTREELEDARKGASASGELSDAELEAVAGGAWGVEFEWSCDRDSLFECHEGYSCSSVW